MTAATTGRFSDPYSYAASLPGMAVEMLVTRPGPFDGRVAWGRLPHLDFVCAHETLSRIAVIALEPPALSATFSMQAAPTLLSDGLSLRAGDIVLHAGANVCISERPAPAAGALWPSPRSFRPSMQRHSAARIPAACRRAALCARQWPRQRIFWG
jgi:hypothetical protein